MEEALEFYAMVHPFIILAGLILTVIVYNYESRKN